MTTSEKNAKLVDSYFSLLKHLSAQSKLDLISKLTKTVKSDLDEDKSVFFKSFGGWDQNESAEELIESINKSRTFSRAVEEF